MAAGFSGGIDSYSLLAGHHFGTPTEGFRLTHLLINNVGSHGEQSELGRKLFRKRYDRLRPAADRMGLPLIPVDSNLDEFYERDFAQTHTIRNASVALLLQEGIGRFLYASSLNYGEIKIAPTGEIDYADPIVLPLLSTESVDMLSVDCEFSRGEKLLRIAKIEDTHRFLDVCFRDHERNCGECSKCKRTLLIMEVAGVLDLYSELFDLSTCRAQHKRYIQQVLRSDDPSLREVVAFACQQGRPLPQSRLVGGYVKLRKLFRPVKKHWLNSRMRNSWLRMNHANSH